MEGDKQDNISFDVPEQVAKSLEKMVADGRKVQVVGRLKDGKLELDPRSLAELEQNFPQADISFVAVNAPFKSQDVTCA